ncbi:MAG TPA: endonuclease/exonuclease/phosphatase family protein [Pyrinomonadaceae bacterium]|nr:endonuclease/exonuclease/phosphatase family protein [Pyrinomonadaceae bacterium]
MLELDQTNNSFLDEEAKLEFGRSNSTPVTSSASSRLIVASYNIRYAVGRYLISSGILRKVGINPPKNRSQAVIDNITTAALAFSEGKLLPRPDILALQEADKGTARAGGVHVALELANKLEMEWIHAPAGIPRGVPPKRRQWWLDFEEQIALDDPGDTGVALLSRSALTDVTRIDLPWHDCAWRPRLAMAASVSVGPEQLRIFNAHIDPHPDASSQLEQLETMIDIADRSTGPTLVMGDFNTLSKQKCNDTRSFLEQRGYTTPFPSGTDTWRGAGLRFHADWIFGRGVRFTKWGVARPLNVSDHWPVWTEVDFAT